MRNRVLVPLSVVTLRDGGRSMRVGRSSRRRRQSGRRQRRRRRQVRRDGDHEIGVGPRAAPPASQVDAAAHAVGRSGSAGLLLEHHLHAAASAPQALEDKALYTKEEAIAAFKKAVAHDAEVDPTTDSLRLERVRDGRLAEPGSAEPAHLADRRSAGWTNSSADRRSAEAAGRRRCLRTCERRRRPDARLVHPLHHAGTEDRREIQGGVTAESQIFQAPGLRRALIESNNDVRIIPLDGRPHLAANMSAWLGDARGHFEGNTLVVETTNFSPTGTGEDRRPA